MKSLVMVLSRRSLLGPAWVFASLNVLIGVWALYIPWVQQRTALSDSELGLALFFMAVGTLISIPVASFLTPKLGCGRATGLGISLFCIAFLFPLAATSFWSLALALLAVGLSSGFTDIAMNTLVSRVEKIENVSFMSAAHGFFSLGGVLGAGAGGLLSAFIEEPRWTMAVVAGLVLMLNMTLFSSYSKVTSAVRDQKDKVTPRKLWPLLGLALVGAIIMASEGAMVDWSGLFLKREAGAVTSLETGLGFTLFSACMTLGRFYGDAISARRGSVQLMLGGTAMALLGYMGVLSTILPVSLIGFSLLGLGYSIIVPELFRLASNYSEIPPETGISFIASFGYTGFLLGPVVLGFLSEAFGLYSSFVALGTGTILVLLLLWREYRRSTKRP